ncbi:MAG: non-oxidative hydroxyarylic acid decarboxylases subunit C [Ruminiclostridium sp.]
MAYQSFRSFIEELEKNGQLVTVHDEINPEPDIRTYLRAAADLGDNGPAVIFDNIKGYKGYKVAGNVHGSWTNHAILLGMERNASIREQFYQVDKLWNSNGKGELKWVKNAPCQEVVIDKDINLYETIPLFRVNQNDGGFYLSKSCVVSHDPDDPDNLDKENVGIYRVMVQDQDTVSIQVMPFHDMARQIKKAEEKNETMPIAICIGNPPIVTTMAATPLGYEQSEYQYASVIMGEPLEVTKALGSNLNVPAGSEFILEGEIIPRQRFCEGPFGEFPGSYSGARNQTRIKIKRITHRKDPIFENLYIGRPWTEHDTMIGLWTSVPLCKQLQADFPEVKCVNALYQHGLSIIISSDIRFGGFAKTLAMKMATTPHGISYAKNIIVVDGDVDPFNLPQVMWALSTRVRADKDVTVITNTPGMPLDPCSEPAGMGNKLFIDATTPVLPDTMREVTMIANPPGSDKAEKRLKQLHEVALSLKTNSSVKGVR